MQWLAVPLVVLAGSLNTVQSGADAGPGKALGQPLWAAVVVYASAPWLRSSWPSPPASPGPGRCRAPTGRPRSPGGAERYSEACHTRALEPVWRRIAAGLVQPDYARAVGWGFGDFVFGSGFDALSDTTKIRTAGFAETLDPADALVAAIERQIAARILPRP